MKEDSDILRSIPISEYITEQLAKMPDKPDLVVAILNHNHKFDESIIRGMAQFKEAYITFTALNCYGASFGICLMGFYSWSEVLAGQLLAGLAALPFDEAAVYIGQLYRMRLLPAEPPASAPNQSL